jgi:two-component system invasion response regulator UvrY
MLHTPTTRRLSLSAPAVPKAMRPMLFTNHIPDDLIDDYALGKLGPSETVGIEEHLLVCPFCCERLEHTDQFIASLRAADRALNPPATPSRDPADSGPTPPPSGVAIRILVADNHEIIRYGLKTLIRSEFPEVVLGEARCAEEALDLVRDREWDAIVLDLSILGGEDLEVLREIKSIRPRPGVLVFGALPETRFAIPALMQGASGYVEKSASADEFVRALRIVCSGKRYLSPALARYLPLNGLYTPKAPHQLLSNREYAVMLAIASGKSITEIGAGMHLSVKTVSTFKKRVLNKLNLRTAADLTRYAISKNLL